MPPYLNKRSNAKSCPSVPTPSPTPQVVAAVNWHCRATQPQVWTFLPCISHWLQTLYRISIPPSRCIVDMRCLGLCGDQWSCCVQMHRRRLRLRHYWRDRLCHAGRESSASIQDQHELAEVSKAGSGARDAAHSGNDIFMIRQMRLAVLASVNLVAIQVDIVWEAHGGWWYCIDSHYSAFLTLELAGYVLCLRIVVVCDTYLLGGALLILRKDR